MIRKTIVVDAKGHLVGRMSSYIAKQLELGQKIVVVRCESAIMGGKHIRNKLNFMSYLHKRCNTNPKHGPIHQKSPSQLIYRTIKGMLPYKTAKGLAALSRLKCFDGCPISMNAKKKMVIPDALKSVRLAPRARFSIVGNICKECGWTKSELLAQLECKRIKRNHSWYVNKIKTLKDNNKAIEANADVKKINKDLEKYGY